MPTYLSPGVYVEEVDSGSRPIEGVGTAVAAFVGLAETGPVNQPTLVTNWSQYVSNFGSFVEGAYLAQSVYGYFQNGGGVCWIVRVGAGDGDQKPQAALPPASGDGELLRATAKEGVTDQVSIEIAPEPMSGEGEEGKADQATYRVVVTAGPQREEFDGLSLKKGRNNVVTKVNAGSALVTLEEVGGAADAPPREGTYTLSVPAAEPVAVSPGEFEGDVAHRRGLGGLAAVDEITMLCIPDLATISENGDEAMFRDVQGKMLAHAEGAKDRIAILDPPPGLLPQEVLEWRMTTAGYDSKFAALYYPWLEVMDPLTRRPMMVPPSGHMAGVWARTDNTRGVHKAPANEVVLGVNGLAFQITHEEQGGLNQRGINCIRAFPGRGIRVWGARTLSSDPEWRYLNVRRLFNYVSESIMEGTQWAVFEPNDERLWIRLRIAVSSFLTRTWREGALFGATPDEAFYVKCDEETNPPDVVEAGQVVCEIGIAPVKPAEFVIFRISQFAAGASEVA